MYMVDPCNRDGWMTDYQMGEGKRATQMMEGIYVIYPYKVPSLHKGLSFGAAAHHLR
jgi:hypothetical protein